MTDFLTRMARHALGIAPAAKAAGAMRYAPEDITPSEKAEETIAPVGRSSPSSRAIPPSPPRLRPAPDIASVSEGPVREERSSRPSRLGPSLTLGMTAEVHSAPIERISRTETTPVQVPVETHVETHDPTHETMATREAALVEHQHHQPAPQPLQAQHVERVERTDRTERIERTERTERVEQMERERVERVERLHPVNGVERIERIERTRDEQPAAIHVTIGRVEVRAAAPPPVPDPPAAAPAPRLSLDEYLKQHNGRQR